MRDARMVMPDAPRPDIEADALRAGLVRALSWPAPLRDRVIPDLAGAAALVLPVREAGAVLDDLSRSGALEDARHARLLAARLDMRAAATRAAGRADLDDLARGRDGIAAQARLILARAALDGVDTQAAGRVHDRLAATETYWREPRLHRRHLALMAQAAETAARPRAALTAMGALVARYPDSREARVAQARAPKLTEQVYTLPPQDDAALIALLRAHHDWVSDLGGLAAFHRHAARLPRHLADLGATRIAAREAARLRETARARLPEGPARTLAVTAHALAEASALLKAGKHAAAAAALDLDTVAPDLSEHHRRLQAQAARGAARLAIDLADPSAAALRARARQAREQGDAGAHASALRRLARDHGGHLTLSDDLALIAAGLTPRGLAPRDLAEATDTARAAPAPDLSRGDVTAALARSRHLLTEIETAASRTGASTPAEASEGGSEDRQAGGRTGQQADPQETAGRDTARDARGG